MRVAWHPLFALKNCNLTNLSASQRQKNQGNFMLYFENTARDITVSKLVRCRLCSTKTKGFGFSTPTF